jgi:hypothetical protein
MLDLNNPDQEGIAGAGPFAFKGADFEFGFFSS